MSVVEKTVALLTLLKPADVQALPPFERRRFSDLLKHLAEIADRAEAPKAGVLDELRHHRAH